MGSAVTKLIVSDNVDTVSGSDDIKSENFNWENVEKYVYTEPTMLVEKENNQFGFGKEAEECSEEYLVHRFISNGRITKLGREYAVADVVAYLKYLWKKIGLSPEDVREAEVIAVVSCNLFDSDRALFRKAYLKSGVRNLKFLYLQQALLFFDYVSGSYAEEQKKAPVCLVDLGAECVNVAIMWNRKIVCSGELNSLHSLVQNEIKSGRMPVSLDVGCRRRIDKIVPVTWSQAKYIRETLETLSEEDGRELYVYSYQNRGGTVSASVLQEAIAPWVDNAISFTSSVIKMFMQTNYDSEELSKGKRIREIRLSGGNSLIPGIESRFAWKLQNMQDMQGCFVASETGETPLVVRADSPEFESVENAFYVFMQRDMLDSFLLD